MNTQEKVRSLVYGSCVALDAEDFGGYLSLCAPEYVYSIVTYSPELRKQMTWMRASRSEMEALLEMVPQHVRMDGRLMRHASVYSMEEQQDGCVKVSTSFVAIHTTLEGSSSVYAAGRYSDLCGLGGGRPLLLSREVRLETRNLGPGSHVPL